MRLLGDSEWWRRTANSTGGTTMAAEPDGPTESSGFEPEVEEALKIKALTIK